MDRRVSTVTRSTAGSASACLSTAPPAKPVAPVRMSFKLSRLDPRALMRDELPTAIASDQGVGKPQRHLAGPAFVRALEVLDAGHHGCLAVPRDSHVHMTDVFGLHDFRVAFPGAVEQFDVVVSLHDAAVGRLKSQLLPI